MRGQYNIGCIKRTENQRKKHVSQMTEDEIRFLVKKIKRVDPQKIRASAHLIEKAKQIDFRIEDISRMLQANNIEKYIIEYNETLVYDGTLDRRVLLRNVDSTNITFCGDNRKPFVAPANMCFVISLISHRIITVYWNMDCDKHKTIDWGRYDNTLKIIK